MEGALLRPRTRDGNQSLWKLHKSADHIVALYTSALAVDAHVLTRRNGTLVLVFVCVVERTWLVSQVVPGGSIKRHTVNLIHNQETNTTNTTVHRPSMFLPECCSLALCALFESFSSPLCLLSALFTRHFPSGGGPGGGWGGVGCPCLQLTGVGLPLHCPNGASRHSWLALVLHRAG